MRINAKRARRLALTAAVVATSVAGATLAPAGPATQLDRIEDTETVYALMDASGALKNTVVVDWLHLEGSGTFSLLDPAPGGGEIESLTDGFEPKQSGDDVVADVTIDGRGDFFYRAKTEKELPVEVKVAYALDGKSVQPTDLAGRSGRLRIEISIHNRLERKTTLTYEDADGVKRSSEATYTVPILCAPQIVLDGTRMFDVAPPEGAQIMVTGSKRTYVVPMVPSPDATATIEMQAENIEIDPIVITALPMLPASPDFSSSSELAELHVGLNQLRKLSDGHIAVVDGITSGLRTYDLSAAGSAAEGLGKLRSGLDQMASGAAGLSSLSEAQISYLDGIIAGIDAGQFDSLSQLADALSQVHAGVSQACVGADSLVTLLDAQIAILDQARQSNSSLVLLAQSRAAAYPDDAEIQTLASGLGQQQTMLDALRDGGTLAGTPMPGLVTTRKSLAELAQGLAQAEAGLGAIVEQAGALSAVPQAFEQLKGALVVLRDGGLVQGQQFPSLKTTASGLNGVASGLRQASSGLASSTATFDKLSSLPKMMTELISTLDAVAHGGKVQGQMLPGISTTVDALSEISSGLATGVGQMREGEALVDAMKAAADSYTSFLGLPEGATGDVSFMLKLDGISKE